MANLIQLQEELKGAPLQSVMQYANGGNPQVPPYMALAELSRRKQMQSAVPVQAPQQTVADTVKQEVGTMAMMAQQQQAAQQQAQQPQTADSGVATLPSDVHTSRFAGGGIVGFAEGGDTWDREGYYGPYMQDNGNSNPDGEAINKRVADYVKRLLGITEAPPEGAKYDDASLPTEKDVAAVGGRDNVRAINGLTMDRDQQVQAPAAPAAATAASVRGSGGGGGAGVAALLRGIIGKKQEADPYDAWMRRRMEESEKAPTDFEDQGIASVRKTRAAAGVKEPEADPGGRITALEKLQQERMRMFQQQQAKRPSQNLGAMLNAFASGNAATKWAAPHQAYAAATKEQQQQDLDQADKNILVQEKMAAFRDAQQKYIEAHRLGEAKEMETSAKELRTAHKELQKEMSKDVTARANAKTAADANTVGHAISGLSTIEHANITTSAHTAGLGTKEQQLLLNAYKIAELHPGAKALADAIKQRAAIMGPDDPQVQSGLAKLNQLVEGVVRAQGQKPAASMDTGAPASGLHSWRIRPDYTHG
jgi:hypothetical protein